MNSQDDQLRRQIADAMASDDWQPGSDEEVEELLNETASEPFTEEAIHRILNKAIGNLPLRASEMFCGADATLIATATTEIGVTSGGPVESRIQGEGASLMAHRLPRNRHTGSSSRIAAVAVVMAALSVLIAGSFIVIHPPDRAAVQIDPLDGSLTTAPQPFAGLNRLVARRRRATKPPQRIAVGSRIQTTVRERRRASLPDGSVLYLDENTSVIIESRRRIRLSSGRLFVEVVPQPLGSNSAKDPFVVETADRKITALGTKFAVKTAPAGTEVLVTQGKVQVSGVEQPVLAGQQLVFVASTSKQGALHLSPARRASQALNWTEDLLAAASPLVPASQYAGGALIAVDPNGQEAKLSLRKLHIDVHIEDGFARTTIDQTYFNSSFQRIEGTFYFPLPPDASLSRLAMYVGENLMEGGMAERNHARNVFEQIMYTKKDPALLEWVDGSTFKMRVFPLEARQEKRIVLSYTQRLPHAYGKTHYRFPAGHSLELVRDWSTRIRVKNGANRKWKSASHDLHATQDDGDLLLEATANRIAIERDILLEIDDRKQSKQPKEHARISAALHEGHRYLMLRYRPHLRGKLKRQRRNWVFLFESSGDRDPLLARVQIDVIETLLNNAEHDDTFAVITAGTRVTTFNEKPILCTPRNVKQAVEFLEKTHLVGAFDFGKALAACKPFYAGKREPHLVHVGSALAVLGEKQEQKLAKRIPKRVRYIGVGVGKRWSRQFMKTAASRTGGHFTNINPDEKVGWRAFELLSTLNAPRLLNIQVHDDRKQLTFLNHADSLAQGEELCSMTRLKADAALPKSLTVTGTLAGKKFERVIPVKKVAIQADYLPRTWAKLEIDRLVAAGAEKHKPTIIALSKAMYVMSPFTSLLVLENEKMYEQFHVDRGRKDHWALYPCPPKIKIVHEPARTPPKTGNEPIEPKDVVAAQRALREQRAKRDVARVNYDLAVRKHRRKAGQKRLKAALHRAQQQVQTLSLRLLQTQAKRAEQVLNTILVRIPPRLTGWSNQPVTTPPGMTATPWVSGGFPFTTGGPGSDFFDGYDVDSDGIDEGIWVDLGVPDPGMTGVDQNFYTALSSFTVYDSDGLLNLDLHGNMSGSTPLAGWDSDGDGDGIRFDLDRDGYEFIRGRWVDFDFSANARVVRNGVSLPNFGKGRLWGRRSVESALSAFDTQFTTQTTWIDGRVHENYFRTVFGRPQRDGGFQYDNYWGARRSMLPGINNPHLDSDTVFSFTTQETGRPVNAPAWWSVVQSNQGVGPSGVNPLWELDGPSVVGVIGLGPQARSGQQSRQLAGQWSPFDFSSRRVPAIVIMTDGNSNTTVIRERRPRLHNQLFGGYAKAIAVREARSRQIGVFGETARNEYETLARLAGDESKMRRAEAMRRAAVVEARRRLVQAYDLAEVVSEASIDLRPGVVDGSWDRKSFGLPFRTVTDGNSNTVVIWETRPRLDFVSRYRMNPFGDSLSRNIDANELAKGYEMIVRSSDLYDITDGGWSYYGNYGYIGSQPAGIFSNWGVFGDLVAHAPGMNTSRADLRAALEADRAPELRRKPGAIDAAARRLIETARRGAWESVTLAGRTGEPATTIQYDPTGRHVYERIVSEGLRERVICDGRTLWHLYDELGLGARRVASRFHRGGLTALIPWLLPPVEELALGVDLELVDERTVAVVPVGYAGKRVRDDQRPIRYVCLHLVFGPDGRLTERRIVVMPSGKVLFRLTWTADGRVTLLDAENKVVSKRSLHRKATPAPDLKPQTDSLVVLPLPYRTAAHFLNSVNKSKAAYAYWTAEDALALIAADYAAGNVRRLEKVIRERFYDRGDRRIGFAVLMVDHRVRHGQPKPPAGRQTPLASFIEQYVEWCRSGNSDSEFVIIGAGQGLVQRLATARNLYVRWSSGRATKDRTARQIAVELDRALKFVRGCRSPHFGWALLRVLQNGATDPASQRKIAAAAKRFETEPGLAYWVRYERARCLFKGNKTQQARELYGDLYLKTVRAGLLPPFDAGLRDAFRADRTGSQAWDKLIREAHGELMTGHRPRTALVLALGSYHMGDQQLAAELFDNVLGQTTVAERPDVALLGIEHLSQTGRHHRADLLWRELLQDERFEQHSGLWRLGAHLAQQREKRALSVARLERAMDLEFQRLPDVVNLQTIRQQYGELMSRYEQLAASTVRLDGWRQGLVAKVIRAADRWRSLDTDDTAACQAAARILSKLGDGELGWDYLTTVVAMKPNEAAPWLSLATTLQAQKDVGLAERAYRLAFEAEPTNAQILFDHAQMLIQDGRKPDAGPLLRKLADGDWQPRFRGLRTWAQQSRAEL